MSEFFIRRPIFAIVVSILMVVLGFITLRGIPISQYPEITPPMIQVNASYTGANSVNMEQTVATPIEQQVNGVEQMLYMRSVNANDGTMRLEVSFEVGTNLDNANMLTQNRVSQSNSKMPTDTFGGEISADGGEWLHLSHKLNLQFRVTSLQTIECDDAGAIDFSGQGTLRGIGGNRKNYGTVFFIARAEDHGQPGKKGDRYYLRVYTADGTTLLLVSGDPANPTHIVTVPIASGNLRVQN
jgi:hypothetical protein